MAFEKDQGTCCLFLPLKLGVGLISMLVFVHSLMCILALITGDIRFQPNGYNPHTYRVPSIVGAFGIVFGFVGLLGVYDEKIGWVKVFNRFLLVKIVSMVVTVVADYWTLRKCDSWLESPERGTAKSYGHMGINYIDSNPAMDTLAQEHVCPWARWAYLIGFAVDFAVVLYFAFKSFSYEWALRLSTQRPIDFGDERHSAAGRWRFYGVKDPRADESHRRKMPTIHEEPAKMAAKYGALGSAQSVPAPPTGGMAAGEAPAFSPAGRGAPTMDAHGEGSRLMGASASHANGGRDFGP